MRRVPLLLLAMACLVPPVIACTRESGGAAATPTATATATSTSTATATSTSTSTATSTADPPAPVTTADPPPPDPKNKAKCGPLADRVNAYLGANDACTSAADCVDVHTPCGTKGVCGAYVSRGKEVGLNKIAGELEAINCFALGVVPCPSCMGLSPPACVGGKCTPKR